MDRTTPPTQKPSLLINRNFALLWSGQAISSMGDMIYDTTLVLWLAFLLVKGQPWAPLAVSGMVLVTSITQLAIRPLAGVFVDRWEKRQTMLVMDGLRAILIGLLLLTTGAIRLPFFADGHLPLAVKLGMIYGCVMLATTCGQFFLPARLALTGDLVPEPARGRAIGLDYVTENLAAVVGPPLAALLFLAGVQWALLINALTFLASLVAVGLITPPEAARSVAPGAGGNIWQELAEGARFMIGNRTLRTITVTICLAMLGFGAVNALNVFFVQQNLHGTAAMYASVSTAIGIGAIAGALIAALVVRRLGEGRAFWLSTISIGVVILCLSRTTLIPLALALAVLSGVLQAMVNVAIGPLILNATPRVLVGRVSSLFSPTITLSALISVTLAGWLASTALHTFNVTWLGIHFGPIDTIYTAGGGFAILAGIYARYHLRPLKQTSDYSKEHHT